MEIPVRLDEHNKTDEQVRQREETYRAAKVLRAAGFEAKVHECWTGQSQYSDAAYITLEGIVPNRPRERR